MEGNFMGPAVNPRYQTLAEIEEEYPDQWVLIDRPTGDKYQDVVGGYVLFGSPVREEVYDKLGELEPKICAVRFTGKEPADKVYCL
jgi:hypothetical protein